MISERLLGTVTCPATECIAAGRQTLSVSGDSLRCDRCGRAYLIDRSGYLDLMPPEDSAHTSLYVAHEDEFARTLDYRRIGPPLLGAGVRQRAVRRMLALGPQDRLIELGCGNGKFVFWNRRAVDWAVGIDPSPLFAEEALQTVDLCRADARALPFPPGTFTAAISIDVLEHLPLSDLQTYLAEAHRVLAASGRLFVFSNTREGSRLDFIVRSARRLSAWLAARGVLDDARDRLRKSDHVKAIATYDELVRVFEGSGFRVEQVVFWNGLFQSTIENLVVKLGESFLQRRRRSASAAKQESGSGQDELRQSMRTRLAAGGPMYRLMRLLTELMWLDLKLFGKWRAGPYFLVAVREEL